MAVLWLGIVLMLLVVATTWLVALVGVMFGPDDSRYTAFFATALIAVTIVFPVVVLTAMGV